MYPCGSKDQMGFDFEQLDVDKLQVLCETMDW